MAQASSAFPYKPWATAWPNWRRPAILQSAPNSPELKQGYRRNLNGHTLTKPSVRIDDHASAGRCSLRRERDFCAGCTVKRNPKAASITARVSSRGLPRLESVRYSVSRESPVLAASAAIPPTASTMVRSATGTARASPSASISSMYTATSASVRR